MRKLPQERTLYELRQTVSILELSISRLIYALGIWRTFLLYSLGGISDTADYLKCLPFSVSDHSDSVGPYSVVVPYEGEV